MPGRINIQNMFDILIRSGGKFRGGLAGWVKYKAKQHDQQDCRSPKTDDRQRANFSRHRNIFLELRNHAQRKDIADADNLRLGVIGPNRRLRFLQTVAIEGKICFVWQVKDPGAGLNVIKIAIESLSGAIGNVKIITQSGSPRTRTGIDGWPIPAAMAPWPPTGIGKLGKQPIMAMRAREKIQRIPATGGWFETGAMLAAPVLIFALALSAAGVAGAQTSSQAPSNSATANPAIAVAIELVLAVDTSISVIRSEFKLMARGMAAAFRNPDIIELIERQGGIAVTLIQWNSRVNVDFQIPWTHLQGRAEILAFADRVETMPRDPARGFTSIGSAIDYAVRSIANNRFSGDARKIDIAGDGKSNSGIQLSRSHKRADAGNIVINGLPILTDHADLHDYYTEEIIHGPGAFSEVANDYEDFARAFLRKLRRELSIAVSDNRTPVRSTASNTNVAGIR